MNKKIVDNFLSKKELDDLKQNINGFWQFNDTIAYNSREEKDAFNSYFVHDIYDHSLPQTPNHNLLRIVFNSFLPKLIDFNSLLRIKANLFTWSEKIQEYPLHKDFDPKLFDIKCKGAIFYLNTCDGYTHFEDGTKVESVENRMLFFDATTLHGSTNTSDSKCRMNINFNYL